VNRREIILQTLAHQEPEVVPNEIGFSDINALKRYVPHFCRDFREDALKRLEFLDNFIVEVGYSGLHESRWLREADELQRITTSRGVSGGGVYWTKVIKETEEYLLFEFETGGRWKDTKEPFWREFVFYPIKNEKDLDRLKMPDPNNNERYKGVEESISFFKNNGYFTSAEVNGFFSGVWYRYLKFENFLEKMLTEQEFIKKLVKKIGKFNYKVAENFLKRGVDSIVFPDDLGSNTGLLISPSFYKKFFWPWHKKFADLCHRYGAYCHMHSHGNINEIISTIIEAGIDILDPVGPSDGMDLKKLKEKYGDKITFMGGISKFINEMSQKELEQHLKDVIEIGRRGGGFITRSEGGINSSMGKDKFNFYLYLSRKYRYLK